MSPSSPKCSVEVFLELGHEAHPRSRPTAQGYTHDWKIWVRGPNGHKIQNFIDRVIFNLHESFPQPVREFLEPPYEVKESGYAGFELPIEIYFRNKEEPKMITYAYDLNLLVDDTVSNVRREKLTFQNPSEDFKKKLLRSGGNETTTPGYGSDRNSRSPADSYRRSVSSSPKIRRRKSESGSPSSIPSSRRRNSHSRSRSRPKSPVNCSSRPNSSASHKSGHSIKHSTKVSKIGSPRRPSSNSHKISSSSTSARPSTTVVGNSNLIAHKHIRSPERPNTPNVSTIGKPKGTFVKTEGKSIRNANTKDRNESEKVSKVVKEEPSDTKNDVGTINSSNRWKPIAPAPEFESVFGTPITPFSVQVSSKGDSHSIVKSIKTEPGIKSEYGVKSESCIKSEPGIKTESKSTFKSAAEKKMIVSSDKKIESSLKDGGGDRKSSNDKNRSHRHGSKDKDGPKSGHDSKSKISKKLLFSPDTKKVDNSEEELEWGNSDKSSASDSDSESEVSRKRRKKEKRKERKKSKKDKDRKRKKEKKHESKEKGGKEKSGKEISPTRNVSKERSPTRTSSTKESSKSSSKSTKESKPVENQHQKKEEGAKKSESVKMENSSSKNSDPKDEKSRNSSDSKSSSKNTSNSSNKNSSSKNSSRTTSVEKERSESNSGSHKIKDKSSKDVKKVNITSTTVSYNANKATGTMSLEIKSVNKEITRDSESSKKSKSKSSEIRKDEERRKGEKEKKETKFTEKSTKEKKENDEGIKKKESEKKEEEEKKKKDLPTTPGKNLQSSNPSRDSASRDSTSRNFGIARKLSLSPPTSHSETEHSPPRSVSKSDESKNGIINNKRQNCDRLTDDSDNWGSDGERSTIPNSKKVRLEQPDEAELKVIRDRINRLRDRDKLQLVVDEIESCPNVWSFVPETNRIEFDLMKLDSITLIKLKKLMDL